MSRYAPPWRFCARSRASTTLSLAGDVRALLALGVTRAQIQEALNVAFAFNVITRLADTFEFEVGPRASFDAGAARLLSRGYK